MTNLLVLIGAAIVVVGLALALLYLVSEERKVERLRPVEPDEDDRGG